MVCGYLNSDLKLYFPRFAKQGKQKTYNMKYFNSMFFKSDRRGNRLGEIIA